MSAPFSLIRDTRHLQLLLLILMVGGTTAAYVRSLVVPADFGDKGPYRAAAGEEIAALPHFLSSDASCLKCHESVHKERKDSPHVAVRCMHCHGNGHQHIAQAELAAKSPETKLEPAKPWDGNFLTRIDLFVTRDRAICLSCHQKVVGMPASFRAIDVQKHLEEQGASEPENPETCFECHTGHNPGI